MTRFSDWSGYIAHTTGSPPKPLYHRALALFDRPGTAVDLGCGAGNETLDLLHNGWSVHAVDSSEAAIRTVTERATSAALPARDTWAELPEISVHPEYAVRELFRGWQLEHFDEVEEDGKSFGGPKHWHLYEVIAARA
ncbi:class I SAM-dependent methyltransferase [Kribbella sp. NPDC006257]|uniref:class I SAM-dependent methyltransferase n=1 Tax=Kribbella sp. NPDC006257 TaxID=3156738 RepID=UPI0033ACD0D4